MLPPKSAKNTQDEMTEIRFHVPGTHTRARGSDAGSQKSDVEDDEETSAAQAFHDAVKEKAEIGQVTGDLVLSFEEVLVLTPRGRYDVDMFLDFLRLRGKRTTTRFSIQASQDYSCCRRMTSRCCLL